MNPFHCQDSPVSDPDPDPGNGVAGHSGSRQDDSNLRPRLDTGQSDLTVVLSPTFEHQRLAVGPRLAGQRLSVAVQHSLGSDDALNCQVAAPSGPQTTGRGESAVLIGPCQKTRFHRSQTFICVLQVLCSVVLVSGLMLTFTILFYVLGVAGALAFAADGPAPVVAIGMASLVLVLVGLIRSFTRTGGRMLMSVWLWQRGDSLGLGADGKSAVSARFAPKRSMSDSWRSWMNSRWDALVDRLAAWLVKKDTGGCLPCKTESPSASPCQQTRTVQEDPVCGAATPVDAHPQIPGNDYASELEAARDSASNILVICLLFVLFFVPTLLVGCFVGYFAAVSMLVFGSVAGATLFVALANALARLSRTIFIIRQLMQGVSTERRLAIFLASSGFDTGQHVGPAICGRFAVFSFLIFVVTNMVQRDFESRIPATMFLALSILSTLFRFRFTLLSWRRLPNWVKRLRGPTYSNHSFNSGNVRGPIAVLAFQAVTLGLGLSCAMAVDAFKLINSPEAARHTVALLAPFAFCYFLASLVHDLTFVHSSFCSPRLVGLGVLGCIFLRCAFAGCMALDGIGCTASLCLAHAYLSINLGDARCFWTHPESASTSKLSLSNRRRFLARALLVTLFVLIASAIATIAGWFTDYKIRVPLPRDDPIFPSNATTISGPPRVAMPACYPLASLPGGKLTPLDIVTLGSSVYMRNETEINNFIWRNPRFNNRTRAVFWTGRKSNSDPPPVRGRPRMAEIRWDEIPNLSVVAIRGTQSYEEVFQNLGYWLPSALVQASSHVGTLAVFWPRVLTSRLVAFLSRTFGLGNLAFDQHVDAYVKTLLSQNRAVLLTGHSLGGAIGMVVGARHKVPAVAFGAPGLGYTYKAFGIELDAVAEWSTNIVMHGDPVASVDDQAGTVMAIPCTSNLPNHCHGWQSVMPNLMRTCFGYRQPEPWN